MSYNKTTWVDHLKSSNTFNISQNADGTYNITPAGNVIQQGTPMSAENLNHIEDGIVDVNQQCAINRTTLGIQRKNLLKLTLTTTTVSGITFTVNDDCSITLNGTATAIIWLQVGYTMGANFRKEKLIFTGNPSGTGSGNGLEAWYLNSTIGNKYVSIANGNILTESEYDSSGVIIYEFHIDKGRTYNNVTYYPMLRYADII
ncbi:MAG: hypothetical protein ACI4Q5_06745, partial [Porcipelethomonas sp.]